MDILDRIIFFFLLQVFSSFIYLFLLRIKTLLSSNIFIYGCAMSCCWALSGCSKGGVTPQLVHMGISLWGPLPLQSTGCRHVGSEVVVHRPSVPEARGILLDQRSNWCPLHWDFQGSPNPYYLSITDACLPGNLRFLTTDSCSEVKGPSSRKIWQSSLDRVLPLMAKF